MQEKIPKIIHYCWFGGNELPESAIRCINSWKKYCKGYKIIQWDESNYDYKKNIYMSEAYDMKKYAFVSDYARLDIIYQYGGIYFDVDVELVKPIDDLLYLDGFAGFEKSNSNVGLGLGLGAIPKLEVIKELRDGYEAIKFINSNGNMNLAPISVYTHACLERKGLIPNGKLQVVEGITIYPADFFCPKDYYSGECIITANTYSIHHYDASWWSEKEKNSYDKQKKLREKSIWIWRIVNGIITIKNAGIGELINKVKRMEKMK